MASRVARGIRAIRHARMCQGRPWPARFRAVFVSTYAQFRGGRFRRSMTYFALDLLHIFNQGIGYKNVLKKLQKNAKKSLYRVFREIHTKICSKTSRFQDTRCYSFKERVNYFFQSIWCRVSVT